MKIWLSLFLFPPSFCELWFGFILHYRNEFLTFGDVCIFRGSAPRESELTPHVFLKRVEISELNFLLSRLTVGFIIERSQKFEVVQRIALRDHAQLRLRVGLSLRSCLEIFRAEVGLGDDVV